MRFLLFSLGMGASLCVSYNVLAQSADTPKTPDNRYPVNFEAVNTLQTEVNSSEVGDSGPTILFSSVEGKRLYTRLCAECHGAEGVPLLKTELLPPPPNLISSTEGNNYSIEQIVAIINTGASSAMPSYRSILTDDQTKAIARYIKSLREKGSK